MRPTIWSLLEPHYKQNLYANPKRTAKSQSPSNHSTSQKAFLFKNLSNTGRLLKEQIPLTPQKQFAPFLAPVKGGFPETTKEMPQVSFCQKKGPCPHDHPFPAAVFAL
jgi:hypothetical protein